MRPIHADEVDCAGSADACEVGADLFQKPRELIRAHLARGHRELPMTDGAETRNVSIYGNIVWRIGKDHVGSFITHEPCPVREICCITTQNLVLA